MATEISGCLAAWGGAETEAEAEPKPAEVLNRSMSGASSGPETLREKPKTARVTTRKPVANAAAMHELPSATPTYLAQKPGRT